MFDIKIQKFILSLGMVSFILFFTHDILGNILRTDYNPITSYLSELTADGAPYADFLRIFLYTSNICLLLFTFGMVFVSFKNYGALLRIGFCLLFLTSLITTISYGAFPMTIDRIFNAKNYIHFILTIIIICSIILSLVIITIGYNRQDESKTLRRVFIISVVLFIFFNIIHLAAIFKSWNILGLVQRLTAYTFYILLFSLSWIYTFKKTIRKSSGA